MSEHQSTRNLTRENIILFSYKVFYEEYRTEEGICTKEDLKRRFFESNYKDDETRESIIGYPSHPLHREIGSIVFQWIESNRCPILDLPSYGHLEDVAYVEKRNALIDETLNPMLAKIKSRWEGWSEDEKFQHMKEFYTCLGMRGQLDLLGLRKTAGTIDMWPVEKRALLQTFNSDHSTREDLTAGAGAIAELGHKDLSKTWWGSATEDGVVKDNLASALCARVLNTATWISINEIPNDYNEVEVRQENGYGMKWQIYSCEFKGVLEPEKIDGQIVGWKE